LHGKLTLRQVATPPFSGRPASSPSIEGSARPLINDNFNELLGRPGYREMDGNPASQLGQQPMFLQNEETSIRLTGEFEGSPLAVRLRNSFIRALAMETKLPEWIRTLPGMSGRKYRYLINNLVEQVTDARYLEVGSWAGSTACSAIFGNAVRAVCIDNWSEFGGPRQDFERNIQRVLSDKVQFDFVEADFRTVDFASLGRFNVYMFDGPHEEEDQFDGIATALACLDEEFVLIVDDYNWAPVSTGTQRAIEALRLEVVASIEIKTSQTGTHPQIAFQFSDWHNGYFLAVCRKTERRRPVERLAQWILSRRMFSGDIPKAG
jgi:hypothetical protein